APAVHCRPWSRPLLADDFGEADTETRGIVFQNDHFPTRDDAAIDHDIDRIADLLVEGDDRAATKLHQIGDRHGRAAKNHLHIDGNAHDEFEIGLGWAFLGAARLFFARFLKCFVQFLLHVVFLIVRAHAWPARFTVALRTARRTKTGSAFFSFGSACSVAVAILSSLRALSATLRAWRMSRVSALRSRFSSSIASSISRRTRCVSARRAPSLLFSSVKSVRSLWIALTARSSPFEAAATRSASTLPSLIVSLALRPTTMSAPSDARAINVERTLASNKLIDEILFLIHRVADLDCEMNARFAERALEKLLIARA